MEILSDYTLTTDVIAALSVAAASNDASSGSSSIFDPAVSDIWPIITEFDGSSNQSLPKDLRFNEGHVVSIVTYSILMVISTIGNVTVLIAILRRRRTSRTRINSMLMHLAIADLLVTFLMMPLEIFWAITVRWVAGEMFCRIGAFFRIFGLYLSSFIIICISIDRYLAILKPMNLYQVDCRGKIMLTTARIAAVICSAPQSVIFHLEPYPTEKWFKQCVMLHAFSNRFEELAYLVFGMIMMYCLPLAVIIFCYTSIVAEIFKRSKDTNPDNIRRSGLGFLGRARSRTLKMTIIMVLVFVICWTPYYVMCVWFWIDPESAKSVDVKVQRALFLFACTNSCANPIVYGIFNIRTRRTTSQIRTRACSGTTACATDIRLPALTLSLRSVE